MSGTGNMKFFTSSPKDIQELDRARNTLSAELLSELDFLSTKKLFRHLVRNKARSAPF